ncbi:hypothetical protein SEA_NEARLYHEADLESS_42 [Mycobacterium phage NearlyHeadless]|nr:hypothetical protein SEA_NEARLYHEADLESS_42 [Mycobacterium phage NearlyHeadless]
MSYWGIENEEVIGKKVLAVFISEDYLVFETDKGRVAFSVEGDCCSWSYFHDIVGADKLLANGPITEINQLDLSDQNYDEDYEYVQVYGYEFVSEHPVWGAQTTVVSFRNSSNGYYGGWMNTAYRPESLNLNELQLVNGEFYEVKGR